jgi:hypothetical protein
MLATPVTHIDVSLPESMAKLGTSHIRKLTMPSFENLI